MDGWILTNPSKLFRSLIFLLNCAVLVVEGRWWWPAGDLLVSCRRLAHCPVPISWFYSNAVEWKSIQSEIQCKSQPTIGTCCCSTAQVTSVEMNERMKTIQFVASIGFFILSNSPFNSLCRRLAAVSTDAGEEVLHPIIAIISSGKDLEITAVRWCAARWRWRATVLSWKSLQVANILSIRHFFWISSHFLNDLKMAVVR